MELELKDKVVVITGGSKGIGLGVARGFAREGAHLVIAARTKAEIEKAASDVRAEYGVKVQREARDNVLGVLMNDVGEILPSYYGYRSDTYGYASEGVGGDS